MPQPSFRHMDRVVRAFSGESIGDTQDEEEEVERLRYSYENWSVWGWLIAGLLFIVLLIMVGKYSAYVENSSDDSNSVHGASTLPDEERRKTNILNLFLSKQNQQTITSDQIKSKSYGTIDTALTAEESISTDNGDFDSSFDLEEGHGSIVLSKVEYDKENTTDLDGDIQSHCKSVSNLCAICLDEYQEGDTIAFSSNTKCTHAFHKDCLVSYLIKVKAENEYPCPCCRQNFFFEEAQDESSDDRSDEH